MLKHTIIEPEEILVHEPCAPLEATDFEDLAHGIGPYITANGKLPGLMIHTKTFPGWVSLDTFLAHMRFNKNHLKNILLVAIVSDCALLEDVSGIATHRVHAQIKQFPIPEFRFPNTLMR